MRFKSILFIVLVIFFSLEVSFAVSDNSFKDNVMFGFDSLIEDGFQDLNYVFSKTFDYFSNVNLSAGNSSIFKGNNIKYTFNSSDLIKDYKNASQYSVQVLADGKPVSAGEVVILRVNGIEYAKTTDSNGTVHLNINLPPGNYIVYCEYNTYKTYNNIKVI